MVHTPVPIRPLTDPQKILLAFFIGLFPLLITGCRLRSAAEVDLTRIHQESLPYRLNRIRSVSGQYFAFQDLNGDLRDEMIVFTVKENRMNQVIIDDLDFNNASFQLDYQGDISLSNLGHDFNGDGIKDVLIIHQTQDSAFVHIVTWKGKTLYSLFVDKKAEFLKNRIWNCMPVVTHITDLNRDGFEDLLILVKAGSAYQPRGAYAYDVRHGRLIWKYPCGFFPVDLIMEDIDDDGRRELLLSSSATGNGKDILGERRWINRTSDDTTYLAVLDERGKLMKLQIIGDEKWGEARLISHDIRSDLKPEILVLYSCSAQAPKASSLAIWNPRDQSLTQIRNRSSQRIQSLCFYDVDKDGKDNLYIAWKDGLVEVLDSRFEKLFEKRFLNVNLEQMMMTDLNIDGEIELFLEGSQADHYFCAAMDRDLKLILYEPDVRYGPIVHLGPGQEQQMIAEIHSGSKVNTLVALSRQGVFRFGIFYRHVLYGFVAGCAVLGISGIFVLRQLKRKTLGTYIRNLLNATNAPILLLDHHGNARFYNDSACRMLNIHHSQSLAGHYSMLLKKSGLEEMIETLDLSYAENRLFTEQEFTISRNGEDLDVILFVGNIIIPDRKESGRLVRIVDVTGISQSRRSTAWAGMAQRLAHEIKTPLSTLMLSMQNLQMALGDFPNALKTGNKYIERVLIQIRRLQRMTDAFLKFSLVEKPSLEKTDLNELISNQLKGMEPRIGPDVKIVKVYALDLPTVSIDRQQISIVIQNLIDNSLNAMAGKGVLTLTTRLVQTLLTKNGGFSRSNVQIEIADTGRGIPKEDLNRVFQPFYSKSPGGTGLGLVIVKKIVDDYRGTIRIESEVDVGTTVWVTFPVVNP